MNWTSEHRHPAGRVSCAMLGDCMEGMAQFPDKWFELAIVDPDYGLFDKISNGGTWASKYKKQDGNLGGLPTDQYWKELFRVSKNQIVWGGNYFKLPETRCFIIWDKLPNWTLLPIAKWPGHHLIKTPKYSDIQGTLPKNGYT